MKVMISCGEASGDLYAGALATEILRLRPDAELSGMGGAHLKAAGGRLLADYHGLAVTGLTEAVGVLRRSYTVYRELRDAARRSRPDVLVAIDFPDFNFRLCRALKRLGVPIIYYISPQVWAWRSGRIATLKRLAQEVLVIFPFEEELYRRAGVPARFVGHPLIDLARASASRDVLLGELDLSPRHPIVALLPGSRPNELRMMLPDIAKAAALIAKRIDGVQFAVAKVPTLPAELFEPLRRSDIASLRIVDGRADDVIAVADVVVTASGTATVQTAIHGKPMVIVYRVSPVTYRIARQLVRLQTFGMVNLIAGRRVVRELIQDQLTPEAVADETIRLLTDKPAREQMVAALGEVRERLGKGGASQRVAQFVVDLVDSRPIEKMTGRLSHNELVR